MERCVIRFHFTLPLIRLSMRRLPLLPLLLLLAACGMSRCVEQPERGRRKAELERQNRERVRDRMERE